MRGNRGRAFGFFPNTKLILDKEVVEMDNVLFKHEGNILTITIDTSIITDVGNKKTLRIATTGGNKVMGETTLPNGEKRGVVVGLNAYVYRAPRAPRGEE
ncbi:MAG: hypothetical protein ACWGQW_04850 [bacterium]